MPMQVLAEAVEVQRERGLRTFDVALTRVVQETPDTVTLYLDDAGGAPGYRAGQFLTIDPHQFAVLAELIDHLEERKGKREPVRAYSMSSAPHEPEVAITVKEEPYIPGTTLYPPLLSPVLVKLVPGTRLRVTGFTGGYVLPDDLEARADHLVHVVAGSGSVPNFAMLKDCLRRGVKVRHTFIYSNKTRADVCFRQELEGLEEMFPDRLRVVHCLTREQDEGCFGPSVRRGRVRLELFRELIPDPQACVAYVCGPGITPWDRKAARAAGQDPAPRFLETAIATLRELGVPRNQIKQEAYG
jgi:3-ketosteroid 9alpha-monooxygenase subunit B